MANDSSFDFAGRAMLEGVARVVAVEGRTAWLEPEQTTSCGGCASAATCGSKGMGTVASRLAARRFPLANQPGLAVGERVVVGVREDALVKASMTAYAIPLLSMLVAGGFAQSAAGSDVITMAAMFGGLAFGLAVARLGAGRLSARGEIAPRFLRRLGSGDSCHS